MEKVIDCPVCYNTDNCFEDAQKTFISYLCFACGFMSDSRYSTNSLELLDNLKNSPKLVRESQFEDANRGIVWFPSVINMGSLGIIFPEGDVDYFVWKYAKVIDIPENEKEKYNGHDKRLDVDNAETFDQNNFMGACRSMGITERIK